jgi:hypothetical protein
LEPWLRRWVWIEESCCEYELEAERWPDGKEERDEGWRVEVDPIEFVLGRVGRTVAMVVA